MSHRYSELTQHEIDKKILEEIEELKELKDLVPLVQALRAELNIAKFEIDQVNTRIANLTSQVTAIRTELDNG